MVLVVRRAVEAQAGVRLAGEPLDQGLRQARLADAGLAGHQHDAALAVLACCQRRCSSASSSSRPTSGVRVARNASKRLSAPLSRNTREATTGAAKPLISTAPRSS